MEKEKKLPLTAAKLVCIVSLAVMTIVLAVTAEKREPLSFVPPPFESGAVRGVPDVPGDLGWGEVDAQAYRVSVCGVIIPDGNRADVWFTNPETNSVWLKLRILDSGGSVIGETGIIRPGEYVQKVTFSEVPAAGETIELKLMAYEPETYYSAGSASLTTTVAGGNT